MAKHTGILSTQGDSAIRKIAVKDNTGKGLLMQPLAPTFTITKTQTGVLDTTDDIQTITLEPAATEGTWRLNISGKTTVDLHRNIDGAGLTVKLTDLGITNTVATGGPLGTSAITLTTTEAPLAKVYVSHNKLVSKPYKWLPTLTEVPFAEIVSNSLYTQTPMWNIQAIFLTKAPTTGVVTFTVQVDTLQTTGQLGPTATAAEFRTALASTTLNAANYEVSGGPWPTRAIVIQFKNELQFQQQAHFRVGTNSFNKSGLPVIWPIGKQILVSYHEDLKSSIVVRPGYV